MLTPCLFRVATSVWAVVETELWARKRPVSEGVSGAVVGRTRGLTPGSADQLVLECSDVVHHGFSMPGGET